MFAGAMALGALGGAQDAFNRRVFQIHSPKGGMITQLSRSVGAKAEERLHPSDSSTEGTPNGQEIQNPGTQQSAKATPLYTPEGYQNALENDRLDNPNSKDVFSSGKAESVEKPDGSVSYHVNQDDLGKAGIRQIRRAGKGQSTVSYRSENLGSADQQRLGQMVNLWKYGSDEERAAMQNAGIVDVKESSRMVNGERQITGADITFDKRAARRHLGMDVSPDGGGISVDAPAKQAPRLVPDMGQYIGSGEAAFQNTAKKIEEAGGKIRTEGDMVKISAPNKQTFEKVQSAFLPNGHAPLDPQPNAKGTGVSVQIPREKFMQDYVEDIPHTNESQPIIDTAVKNIPAPSDPTPPAPPDPSPSPAPNPPDPPEPSPPTPDPVPEPAPPIPPTPHGSFDPPSDPSQDTSVGESGTVPPVFIHNSNPVQDPVAESDDTASPSSDPIPFVNGTPSIATVDPAPSSGDSSVSPSAPLPHGSGGLDTGTNSGSASSGTQPFSPVTPPPIVHTEPPETPQQRKPSSSYQPRRAPLDSGTVGGGATPPLSSASPIPHAIGELDTGGSSESTYIPPTETKNAHTRASAPSSPASPVDQSVSSATIPEPPSVSPIVETPVPPIQTMDSGSVSAPSVPTPPLLESSAPSTDTGQSASSHRTRPPVVLQPPQPLETSSPQTASPAFQAPSGRASIVPPQEPAGTFVPPPVQQGSVSSSTSTNAPHGKANPATSHGTGATSKIDSSRLNPDAASIPKEPRFHPPKQQGRNKKKK